VNSRKLSSASAPRTDDAKAFLGRGFAFPPGVTATGAVALAEYEEDVRQAILIVLETEPGERVMRPDFGAGLRGLVFESINANMLALARHRAEQALVLWEPRIDSIDVSATADAPRGVVTLEIRYRIRATNTFYNLVYPFYVQEGGSG
jgi:phage baseplate assembly protein W